MRCRYFILVASFCLGLCVHSEPQAKILKVLEHRLDQQGRIALAPSLYERDAYQAFLRHNPSKCSGVRFDIHWRARRLMSPNLSLKLEAITTKRSKASPLVLQSPAIPRRYWSRWSALRLDGKTFEEAGEVIAWRATLWDGDKLLAEQKSFLW